jgi:hypothetical protein
MDTATFAKIDASRQRLQQFVDNATDDQLAQTVDGDWTVSAFLAHLAFWDRRAAYLLRRAQQGDLAHSPIDLDSTNGAALHQWLLIPPRAAAQEALAAAEDMDRLVASLSPDLITAMQEAQTGIRFDRSNHRNAHLDQIERALSQT